MLPSRWTDRMVSCVQLRWPLEAPYEVLEERDVNIERVWYEGDDTRYFYTSRGKYHVGVWPGIASDEWIEYIPEPKRDHDPPCLVCKSTNKSGGYCGWCR